MRKTEKIILFDGVCNLCNGGVQFVLKADRRQHFKFASLQSDKGRQLALDYGINPDAMDTLIVITNNRCYTKSSAVFHLFMILGFPFYLLCVFKIIPRFLTDFLYDIVAKNRYKIFGKRESCLMPDSKYVNRFI